MVRSIFFQLKHTRFISDYFHTVDEFCRERGYEFEGIQDVIGHKHKLKEFNIKDLNLPFEPRDYQLEAFASAVKYGRQLLLSPTASGKSLIIYMLARYYDVKTVIIVPTTSLVEQMTKDFQEYGYTERVCKIYSGQEVFDAPITVTTWQSFAKAPKGGVRVF